MIFHKIMIINIIILILNKKIIESYIKNGQLNKKKADGI